MQPVGVVFGTLAEPSEHEQHARENRKGVNTFLTHFSRAAAAFK
jgi:hypothetical protein